MIIVYAIDENYKKLTEISIKTVKKNNPEAKIIVVSEKPIDVKGMDENYIFDLGGQHRNRGFGDRITNAAYLKLMLPELPYDKVIFMDGDTICQKPLNDLWEYDIEYIGVTESHSYGKKQAKELGLKKYALSSMMVMNLKNLRKLDFTKKSFEFEKTNQIPTKLWRHEETILNILWEDILTFLPVKFNYCYNREYDNQIKEQEAVILHIIGKDKSKMLEYDL